jgi:hypothetical protein
MDQGLFLWSPPVMEYVTLQIFFTIKKKPFLLFSYTQKTISQILCFWYVESM